MRVARLACLIIVAVAPLAAPALAQGPAVHQYTAPGQGIKSETVTGSSGGTGSSDTTGSSGTTGSGGAAGSSSAGTSGQAATGATAGGSAGAPPPTLRLSFGAPDPRLTASIGAAMLQGGMAPSLDGRVTKQRLERFLDSKLADELGDGEAEAVGRAVGQLVVDPGAGTSEALKALLGFVPQTGPATHAIFTRTSDLKGDLAKFQRGLVKGSSDVPRAYVELSSAAKSFVKLFDGLGVPTVDDLDTAAGKAALVAILVSGAEGNFGGKPTADSKLVDGEVRPISATTSGGLDPGVGYVLAIVVAAMLWSVLGLRPRRRRG
jgi:hypothetical protein